MEKIIFAVHSMVDVITNSSTELFIIDAHQELDLVKSIIKEKEKEFPTEYNYNVSISIAEEWDIKDMFGYIDEDQAIKYLKAIGYKIEPPKQDEVSQIRYIKISCESGCMNPSLRRFIETTFTVIEHDN